MENKRIKTYKEFYEFYLSEHCKKGTRITHFIGTSLFILFFLLGVFTLSWKFVLGGIVSAYGLAWIGHFFIEKNKPATFQYPFWSLISDFKLYFQIWMGKEGFEASAGKD
jgi:hypothetical protein